MPGKAYAGRVGGVAIALVIAVAVMTGWHSGLAWADETGGTAGSTTSTAGTETKADQTDVGAPGKTNDDVGTPTEAADPPKKGADETPPIKPSRKTGANAPTAKPAKPKPATVVSATSEVKHETPADATPQEKTAANSGPSDPTPPTHAALRIATTESPAVTTAVTTPKPVQPNVIRAVTALVSGVVNAILSPFAASSMPGGTAFPALPSIPLVGDIFDLPGYPFTFAVYKQIAADNAAIVTEAFLQNWDEA